MNKIAHSTAFCSGGGTKGTAPFTAKRYAEQFSFKLGFVLCGTERNGHIYE